MWTGLQGVSFSAGGFQKEEGPAWLTMVRQGNSDLAEKMNGERFLRFSLAIT